MPQPTKSLPFLIPTAGKRYPFWGAPPPPPRLGHYTEYPPGPNRLLWSFWSTLVPYVFSSYVLVDFRIEKENIVCLRACISLAWKFV